MKKRLFLIPLCVLLLASCGRATFDGGEILTAEAVTQKQEELAAKNAASTEETRVTADTPCYWIAGSDVYHVNRNCAYIKNREDVRSGTVGFAESTGDMHACPHCSKPQTP